MTWPQVRAQALKLSASLPNLNADLEEDAADGVRTELRERDDGPGRMGWKAFDVSIIVADVVCSNLI